MSFGDFGDKHCGSINDVKIVCPECLKRYFLSAGRIPKGDTVFDVICPHCGGCHVNVDLSQKKDWYGEDPSKEPKQKDFMDLVYVGSYQNKVDFEKEMKERFPSDKINSEWDSIHEYQTSLYLPGNLKRDYFRFLFKNGWASVSFLIQMTLMEGRPTADVEIIKQLVKEMKEELTECT